MKAYTDLEQSKNLAKILPLESADMFYRNNGIDVKLMWEHNAPKVESPCWSLAALLSVLPKVINNETLFIETSPALWHIGYRNNYTARADNPIDACYEMVLKLHKLNLL
jgi:hypothetical protein